MSGLQGKQIWAVCAVAILAGMWAPAASADAILGRFFVVEDNSIYDVGDQLSVLVETSDTAATFTFFNLGSPAVADPISCHIEEIYWDDLGTLLLDYSDPASWLPSGWWAPAKPEDLPGGNTLIPAFVADFSTEDGGIYPGDAGVAFEIDYAAPATGEDVINALLAGTFRLGVHIQGLPDGDQSETYATGVTWDLTPEDPYKPPVVPVPAAAGLGFLGMGLVGLMKAYRRIR